MPRKSKKHDDRDVARTFGLGFSPCPNDTFMFHALVTNRVVVDDVRFAPVLLDIEELNQRALGLSGGAATRGDKSRPLMVTKLSVPALAHVTKDFTVLSAGAALGKGVGPLVVRNLFRGDISVLEDLDGLRVAVPGLHTTAALLLGIFGPKHVEMVPMRFDKIMAAVARGKTEDDEEVPIDAGVIIHESRITYRDHDLIKVCDLGETWEEKTDLPLPLGVIACRRDLPRGLIDPIEEGIRESVAYAMEHPDESWEYIREHAQEMDEEVCLQHIELYVNEYSKDLGEVGKAAIEEILNLGRASGRVPRHESPWR